MATYTLISSVTVGSGGAANMEFTSIPGTYTDLVLKISGRSTSAPDPSGAGSNYDGMGISFNSSTTNWTYRDLYGTGAAVSTTSGSSRFFAFVVGFNATATTFSNNEYYIPNYTSSNNKSVSLDSVTENNGTTVITNIATGLWSNSAAITSITLSCANGNFVQYSTATLYGISNA